MPPPTVHTAKDVLLSHSGWLRNAIYSRLANQAEVEDVMQEVSLAAARREQHFDSIDDVKHWLLSVSLNQIRQLYRQKGRMRRRETEYAKSRPSQISVDQLTRLCRDENGLAVAKAVSQLRAEDREVLTLKYGEGKKCAAIAKHLGLSATSVQSRLLRARRRLRQTLLSNPDFGG